MIYKRVKETQTQYESKTPEKDGSVAFKDHKLNLSPSMEVKWHFELIKIWLCWHTCICLDIWLPRIFTKHNLLRLPNSILVRGSLSSQNKTPTYEKLKCKNFMSLALRHNLQQKKGSRGLEACVENMGWERVICRWSGLEYNNDVFSAKKSRSYMWPIAKWVIAGTKSTHGLAVRVPGQCVNYESEN